MKLYLVFSPMFIFLDWFMNRLDGYGDRLKLRGKKLRYRPHGSIYNELKIHQIIEIGLNVGLCDFPDPQTGYVTEQTWIFKSSGCSSIDIPATLYNDFRVTRWVKMNFKNFDLKTLHTAETTDEHTYYILWQKNIV